jgi:hypothetical protein
MGNDSISRAEPEPTKYDKNRREAMTLKRNGLYGIPKVFVKGSKPEKLVCERCENFVIWCTCANNK